MKLKLLRPLAAVAFAGLATVGTAAQARSDVFFSLGVQAAPGVSVGVSNAPVMVAPAPVYVAPQPVYVQPAPVYMAPPVVVRPAPVIYAPARVYYGGPGWRHGHGHRHHHH